LPALHYATWDGNAELTRMLLAAGAQPNLRDARGLTPLWYAVWLGRRPVETMLRTGGGTE